MELNCSASETSSLLGCLKPYNNWRFLALPNSQGRALWVNLRVCMYVCMYVRTYVCMYIYMYVCMYVCMYACTYVCMYVRMHVYMYVCICIFARMFACIYVCMYMYICMYVCIHVRMYAFTYVCMHVYMYVCICIFACMYVCMHVCIYVCMYVCMYVDINVLKEVVPWSSVFLQELKVPKFVTKFPSLYGTKRLLTFIPTPRHPYTPPSLHPATCPYPESHQPSPSPDPVFSTHILILVSLLSLCLSSDLFGQISPPETYIYLSSPYICYMTRPSDFPWFGHTNCAWLGVQFMKLLVMYTVYVGM
jgi:hypothetical protein